MEKLFLFDIDGTLLRSGGAGKRSFDKAFFSLFGIESAFKNVDMHGMLDPIIYKNALDYHGIKENGFNEFKNLYIEYLKEESQNPKGWYTVDGVFDFLTKYQDLAYFALLTGNIFEGAVIKLSTLNLIQYFPDAETGAFGDDAEQRKYLGDKALNKLNIKYGLKFSPENIFVFGDTQHDIAVAKHIGAKSIALSSGGISLETLSEYNPDILANNFQEIIDNF